MASKTIDSNSKIRAEARKNLQGNWLTAVLLYLVFSVIFGLTGFIPQVGFIINLIITGPFTLGLVTCFLNLVRNKPFRFENLFDGFSNFKSAFLIHLLKIIFISLWSLLLVIPGIIAYYRYSMAFYILHDNPEIGAKEAIDRSKEMMAGYKGKLFLLHLSFIGWGLLTILTLGIGSFWLIPYMKTAQTNFYQNLKEKQNSNLNQTETETL